MLIEQRKVVRATILQRIRENRQLLNSFISVDSPCHCLKTEGGWYSVLRVPSMPDDEQSALDFLEKYGVFVHPGAFYDFPFGSYLVFSMITPTEIFATGLKKMFTDHFFT